MALTNGTKGDKPCFNVVYLEEDDSSKVTFDLMVFPDVDDHRDEMVSGTIEPLPASDVDEGYLNTVGECNNELLSEVCELMFGSQVINVGSC